MRRQHRLDLLLQRRVVTTRTGEVRRARLAREGQRGIITLNTVTTITAYDRHVQQLFDTGGVLYEACLHCHGEYIDAIKNVK